MTKNEKAALVLGLLLVGLGLLLGRAAGKGANVPSGSSSSKIIAWWPE